MKTYQAVLFDVDGTLLDTKEFIYQAYEHVFRTFNLIDLTRTDTTKLVELGKPLEECYTMVAPELDTAAMCDAHRHFQEQHLELVVPYPHAIETLKTLQADGIKTTVISTRKRTGLISLEHAGMVGLFDTIITGDDTVHSKPHPEGVLKALDRLHIVSHEALMVGDTPVDIEAGKNAKTSTAAAVYGFSTKEKLAETQPDYFINDIREILQIVTR